MKVITVPEDVFPIGTEFILKRGKINTYHRVVDYLKTYNSAGELVKFRYVTEHEFMGQIVKDYDVLHTTIKRAIYS